MAEKELEPLLLHENGNQDGEDLSDVNDEKQEEYKTENIGETIEDQPESEINDVSKDNEKEEETQNDLHERKIDDSSDSDSSSGDSSDEEPGDDKDECRERDKKPGEDTKEKEENAEDEDDEKQEDTATPEKSEETPSEPKPEDEKQDDQDKETTEEGEDTATPEKSEETPSEPKLEDETKTVVDGEDTATPEKSEETPSEPKPEEETKTVVDGEDTATPEKSEETPSEPKPEDETKTVVDGEDTATPEKSEETPSEPKPEDETKTVVDGEDTATPEKSEETPSEPKPEDETKTVVDGEDTATPEKSGETPSEPKPEDETKDDQAVETAEEGGIEKAGADESQESKSKEEEIVVKTAAGVLGVPLKEQPVMDVEDKAVTAQTKTTDVEGSVTVTSKTEDVLTAQIEEQKPSDEIKDDRHPKTQIDLVRHYERELQNLNERLACYVDVVRKIETGGGTVRKVWTALNASEENVIASIGDLKIEYGKSLSSIEELFKKVEETRTFKERETYDVNEKNRELRQRLSKLEAELSERTVELKQASIEKEQLHEDLSTKSHELDKVRADIDAERELRQKIEESYNMEFLLQNQFETQMKEIKMIKKEMIEDIIKGDKQGAEEERMKLKATLKKWSEYYQNQLQKYKENFEIKYEKEIQRLKKELEADRNQLIKTDYELRVNLVKTGELDSQLKSVRAKSTVMEEEIRELEERRKELIIQSEQMAAVIKERDEEIRQLKMKADITSQDQTDSVSDSDRILLDKEIDKFRKLLEIEEERLNLGEDQRKEMDEIDSPTQLIKIEVDESKKFLKLENISGEDQSLGGYELKRKKGEQEFNYRFKSGQVLKAGSTLTLWTKGQREEEETDTDLKIEDVDDFSDDESDTLLHDVQGQVKSVHYSKKFSSVTVSS